MADVAPSSYDGFLSYSHAADGLLAPRLQSGLQRFAKPWWRRRALRVFRDEASLSANPHLWSSITAALDDSDWFVLLLSPEAAGSEWVNREIDYWVEHRDPQKILPVVTDGSFGWSDGEVTGDAVPASLRGVFSDEPRWVDLRFARTETQLDLRHTRFRDAVADIAAAVRGVAKDELVSEEIRQHRRTIRTAWTGGIVILALGIAATVGAIVAVDQSNQAQAQRDQAQQDRDRAVAAEETATEERDRANQEADRANLLADQEASARAEAEANLELARSRRLAASAINVLDDDPELSVLLALQAAQSAEPAFESVSALHEAIQNHRTVRTITWPAEWTMDPALTGSISPNGRFVVVSGARHQMAVWDLESAEDEPIWSFELPWPDYVTIMPGFNSDGSHVIATAAWFNLNEPADLWPEPPPEVGIYIFDTETGEVIDHLRGPECPINSLFQSGRFLDETRLVGAVARPAGACASSVKPMIWLLDLNTGEMELGSEDRAAWINWKKPWSLSQDGRMLSYDDGWGTSVVVDVETGEELLATGGGWISLLSKDGSRLLTGGQRNLSLWDINSATELWNTDTAATTLAVTFSEDDDLIYAGGTDGAVRIWDATTGSLLRELKGHRSYSWNVSLSVDGTRMASFSADRTVRIWDLTANAEGEIAGFDLPGIPMLQSGQAAGDKGAVLLYPGRVFIEPGEAVVFEIASGEVTRSFPDYGGQMVRLSPDGDLLAGQPMVAPGVLGPVHIRDVESGEVLVELDDLCTWDDRTGTPGPECAEDPEALADFMWQIAFSSDGSMVAMNGYSSGTVGVWDVESGRRLAWLSFSGPADALGFSPTSELLVADGATLVVYESEGWSQIASVSSISGGWFDLLFTPDGRRLIAAADPKGFVTIDTTTWQYVGDLLPYNGVVRDFDLNADGFLIATGGPDGFVRILSTQTDELVQTIPLGETPITFVEFIDDSHLLIIDQGRRALVMTIDIPELLDIGRSRITRGFTADECTTYHIEPCPDLETIQGG